MKKYIGFAITALLLAGCSSDDSAEINSNILRVEASLDQSRATLTSFEEGDMISLYAVEYSEDGNVAELQSSGNYLNNEIMTYNGSSWDAKRTLYWSEHKCDFYGIYPSQNITSINDVIFNITADQSTPSANGTLGGYENSDLMWAKTKGVRREDGTVRLAFSHMMSRVIVYIIKGESYGGELPENIVVSLYNTITTAKIDWRIGSIEKYAQGNRKTIKMRQIDADSFDAIVVPQFIERSTPLVEITMDGIAYLLEKSVSFRPGMQHIFNVTLNKSPDQEKIEISIDGEVEGWS